jgi:aspartate semialdehyde dehydrogenase (EC 1.2.1.11)
MRGRNAELIPESPAGNRTGRTLETVPVLALEKTMSTEVLEAPVLNRRLPAHPVVAIVGATGAVGIELIESLTSRDFPVAELRLLASARSAGTRLSFAAATSSCRS